MSSVGYIIGNTILGFYAMRAHVFGSSINVLKPSDRIPKDLISVALLFQASQKLFLIILSKKHDPIRNKAIEDICGKSTRHGSFSRLAALIFSKKQKIRF